MGAVGVLAVLAVAVCAAAFSFEFYYFETDKQVYEVGETVHMTAKMTADFDDGGWCYVSFSVVLNETSVHQDGFYLRPSPLPQYPSSTFLITPESVHPGENGLSGFAIFDYDFYDPRYSEASSVSIEINVTRGHLEAVPLEPLEAKTGANVSFSFRVTSIHTEQVVMKDEAVYMSIANGSDTLLESQVQSDSEGVATFPISTTGFLPGQYDLTIATNGTSAFLPLEQRFVLNITPQHSRIDTTYSPSWAYCRSPTGEYQNVTVRVKHSDDTGNPITKSNVTWSLGNYTGVLFESPIGEYSAQIPVLLSPGDYQITIQATNPLFETVSENLSLRVDARPLASNWIVRNKTPVAGEIMSFAVCVADNLSGKGVGSALVSFSIHDLAGQTVFCNGTTNSTGWMVGSIVLPSDTWGRVAALLVIEPTEYFRSIQKNVTLDIWYRPSLVTNHSLRAVVGYDTNFSCLVADPLGRPISGVSITVYNASMVAVGSGTTNEQGIAKLSFFVPHPLSTSIKMSVGIGYVDSLWIAPTKENISVDVLTPVNILIQNACAGVRGENATIRFHIDSEWLNKGVVSLLVTGPSTNQSVSLFATLGTNVSIDIPINSSLPVGVHPLRITTTNATLEVLGNNVVPLVVRGLLTVTPTATLSFFGEPLILDVQVVDDLGTPLAMANLSILLDEQETVPWWTSEVSLLAPIEGPILNTTPGLHTMILVVNVTNYSTVNVSLSLFVWIRVNMVFDVSRMAASSTGQTQTAHSSSSILSSISPGSISRPPPTLVNVATSTTPLTACSTAHTSCPRLSSGTKILSTDLANDSKASSGNGHKVRSLNDLTVLGDIWTTSSTLLAVLPKETMPHCALLGPVTTGPGNRCLCNDTFSSRRRTR